MSVITALKNVPIHVRHRCKHLRAAFVSAAQADPNITGAAHLVSAAVNSLDSWSDIDLALCVSPEDDMTKHIALSIEVTRDHLRDSKNRLKAVLRAEGIHEKPHADKFDV